MKTVFKTLLALAFLSPAFATATPAPVVRYHQNADSTYTVTLVIKDITHRNGKLLVGLADSEQEFMSKTKIQQKVDVPATGDATVTFEGVKPGKYAARVLQDLNENNQMDMNGQMPGEPFGFSNVAMLMGPPSFDQSSFEVKGNTSVEVKLLEL